jgi:hypothetical protein
MSDPNDYRGDVVHVEGRLKRVRRFNPPIATDNIRDLYEGWMFVRERGADPVCLLFTELPEGLSVADKMEAKVAFDGYFFKRYRFKTADSGPNQAREAPLLIGRSLILLGTPVVSTKDSSDGDSSAILIGFLGMVAMTVTLALGLTWWFRRSDRHVRARLAGAISRDFQVPLPDDDRHNVSPEATFAIQSSPKDQTPLPFPSLPPTRFPLDSNDPKPN